MVAWNGIELPGFDAPLSRVAPERRQALAAHLRQLVAGLTAPAAQVSARPPTRPDGACGLAAACAACGGHCCRNGRDSAYLDVEAMVRIWSGLAHLTADDLVSAYADAVPDQALAGSCIFHARHGCNLPRAMRSPTCLSYLCAPLRDMRKEPAT